MITVPESEMKSIAFLPQNFEFCKVRSIKAKLHYHTKTEKFKKNKNNRIVHDLKERLALLAR